MEEISPEYLKISDLAVYAAVSEKTLKKWAKSGMPIYKVGRCIRISKSEFNTWMRQFRIGASEDLDAIWGQVMEEA